MKVIVAMLVAGALGFTATLIFEAHAQEPDPVPCLHVPLAVVVDLNNDRQAPVIDHVRDAVRDGQPRVLHIARGEATANRAASLRNIPVRTGFDRDEYPPAMSDEGGAGADVRYISPRANRSAGSTMGRALEPFCGGQAFIVEP